MHCCMFSLRSFTKELIWYSGYIFSRYMAVTTPFYGVNDGEVADYVACE